MNTTIVIIVGIVIAFVFDFLKVITNANLQTKCHWIF